MAFCAPSNGTSGHDFQPTFPAQYYSAYYPNSVAVSYCIGDVTDWCRDIHRPSESTSASRMRPIKLIYRSISNGYL